MATFSMVKIDDVHELVKSKPEAVPERYIRPQQDRVRCTALNTCNGLQMPVIDMAKLVSGGHSSRQNEMARLSMVCKEWGFFQVFNHGIDRGLLERIKKTAMEFFKLPLNEKKMYIMMPGKIQRYGQGFIFSDEQKLDWCHMTALATMPKFIRKENLWAVKPLVFRDTVEAYSLELFKLCRRLLSLIAEILRLKPNIFEEMFGQNQ